MRRVTWMFAMAFLLAAAHVSARTPSFLGLGSLASGHRTLSIAEGVSADGSTVVGRTAIPAASGFMAFRWRQDTGMVGIPYAPGYTDSSAWGVSADGSTVCGSTSASDTDAFVWSESAGTEILQRLPSRTFHEGLGISDDGSTVVGGSRYPSGSSTPFHWRRQTGTADLGTLPGGSRRGGAWASSSDGSVVVGSTGSADGYQVFRWTEADGTMTGLGDLPGGEFESSARGVSSDGSVVVGHSRSGNSDYSKYEAFRWTAEDGMVGLGDLPGGAFDSTAYDVSADGSVVVGRSELEGTIHAMFWEPNSGMQDLQVFLEGEGIDLAGWNLQEALAVSDDGTVIVGFGQNPQGHAEAWMAVIPEPATLALLGLGGLGLIRMRRRPSRTRVRAALARRWGLLALLLLGTLAGPAFGLDWSLEDLDSSGNSYSFDTSIAVDSVDRPHIAYVFGNDNILRYARWTGQQWELQQIGQTNASYSCLSMALSPDDAPQIVYKAYGGGVDYAAWDGAQWQIETVSSSGYAGAIAVDAAGTPHVSYINSGQVRYATRDVNGWTSQQIGSSSTPYRPTAITLDSQGNPHLAYWRQDYSPAVRYTYWDGADWQSTTVGTSSSSDADGNVAIVLDDADVPHITYCAGRALGYATIEEGVWVNRTVPGAYGSGVGYFSAVTIGPDGEPWTAFNYRVPEELWVAAWDGQSWDTEVLDTGNAPIGYCSLATDSSDNVHLSYWRAGTLVYGVGIPEPVTLALLAAGGSLAIRRGKRTHLLTRREP